MNAGDKELINIKFKGVYEHQQANFDLMSEKLDQIHKQTLLTNGRVTVIEKQTSIIRFFERNPKIMLLVVLGVLFLVSILDIKELIAFLK